MIIFWMRRFAPVVGLITAMTMFLLTMAGTQALAQTSVRTVGPGIETIEIEVNKGALVRLPEPASAVFVANPDYADISMKSPTLVYVMAKRTGETSLFALDSRDSVLANVNLMVTHNVSALSASLRSIMPDTAIEARSVPGGLMLAGLVNSATESEEARRIAARFLAENEVVVNQIRVIGPNQVNLQVRIAEVSRDVLKRLGFNFDVLADVGAFSFGLASGRQFLNTARTLVTGLPDTGLAQANYITDSLDVAGVVDALETEGLISLLAEPNLTALSGETASFLAGGEFPVPVVDDDGEISVTFKPFGVSLAFTPTILGAERISLKVLPEVSALSSSGAVNVNGLNIPALTTRRANTTVELGSGQSFAIAGLLQADSNQNVNEFPGLADIPILGALFRSTEFNRQETELVIIVTPYLVRPVSTNALLAPTDGFEIPDDFDRVMKGETQRQKAAPSERVVQTPDYAGDLGAGGFQID
ncbi:MAG: type II and III secretion system protein family protein [Alphaproteobacteria bacterium]|nr:type II and III secretion system protein family protein [Alphaproteobacteria bacterium]